jgi:hypothetical protein
MAEFGRKGGKIEFAEGLLDGGERVRRADTGGSHAGDRTLRRCVKRAKLKHSAVWAIEKGQVEPQRVIGTGWEA